MTDNGQQVTSQDNSTNTTASTGSNNNDCVCPLPDPDPALVYRVTESADRERDGEKV